MSVFYQNTVHVTMDSPYMYNDGYWQMTWLTIWSGKGRPTVICIVLQLLYIF